LNKTGNSVGNNLNNNTVLNNLQLAADFAGLSTVVVLAFGIPVQTIWGPLHGVS